MNIVIQEYLDCIKVVSISVPLFIEHNLFSLDSSSHADQFEVILLTGINLEIADAASKSGFNTYNHDALMNLIWSVKRVILQNARVGRKDPPPQHPIYPDRYRPSGVGDNTHRKRFSQNVSPPPFYSVQQLHSHAKRKKRKNKQSINQNAGRRLTVNTAALDRVLGSSARVSKPTSNILTPVDRWSTQRGNREASVTHLATRTRKPHETVTVASALVHFETVSANKTRQEAEGRTITNVRTIPGTHTGRTVQASQPTTVNLATNDRANTVMEIISILSGVQVQMETAGRLAEGCQATMRKLFERNSTRLSNDDIFRLMESMSDEMLRAQKGAEEGVTTVKKAIVWFEGRSGSIKAEAA